MRIHRAITLVLLIVVALLCFALITSRIVSTFDARSLIALLVLVAVCAVGGVAVSWRRYRPARGAGRGRVRPPGPSRG
ncbi:MAG: hypothetical protein ACREPA_12490 [Candidatus Dormibacteraceae bacterium]